MGFFSKIASFAAPIIGGLVGGPAGAAVGAGLGLSYLGSEKQSTAAKRAARSQVAAGDRATQAQLEMFYQSREDIFGKGGPTPWSLARERGLEGLEATVKQYQNVLAQPSLYTQSPGFNWLRQQGEEAMLRGASAGGRLDEGGLPKDFAAHATGLASQDYGNYLNRLVTQGNLYSGLSGAGLGAATQVGQLGSQTAANVGNIAIGQGNALASQYINQANARTGLYSNIMGIGSNALNQYMMYQGMGGSGGGGGYQLPADIASFNPTNALMHMAR